jgi:type II secretory pathway component PulF
MSAKKPGVGKGRGRRAPRKGGAKKLDASTEEDTIALEARVSTRPPGGLMAMRRIRYEEITTFIRQLVMLLESGTPLLRSLRSLSERGQNSSMRALVGDIADFVEAGNPLYQAFARHARYFDTVFVSLVKASEASGTLITVLQRIADHRERRQALRKRVQGAMLYPVVLVFVCAAVLLLIAKVVVPGFEDLFVRLDTELPVFTRSFIAVTDFVGARWWMGVVLLVVLIFLYKVWVRSPLNRLHADRIKLKIPIIGTVLRDYAIVEFTRSLALLLRSGLPMMATLDLVRSAIHSRAVSNVLQNVRDSVEQGGGIEEPLREAENIVPSVVTDMLVTGEEAGQLDHVAAHIADVYEEDVNSKIYGLGEALQPILTVVIGVVVLMLALALFVPMLSALDQLGSAS